MTTENKAVTPENKRRVPRKRVRRTPESYRKEVEEQRDREYTVLGDFSTVFTKVAHLHKSCGYSWNVAPRDFLKGGRCPNCAKNAKHLRYLSRVLQLVNNEYIVVGKYVDRLTPILHYHEACGSEWYVSPRSFVHHGARCLKCSLRAVKTHEEYVEEVGSILGDEYKVLGRYRGRNIKLIHLHVLCGTKWNPRPNDIMNNGVKCPTCFGTRRRFHYEYVSEVSRVSGEDYKVLEEYINSKTPILHRHVKCGYKWRTTPYRFLSQGSRCPRCNEPKGERRISEVLDAIGAVYESQYRLKKCRANQPLPFDRAVFTSDGPVMIEYDGVQHTRPVDYAGKGGSHALAEFKKRKHHDRIKTEYCRANGIPLIRIDYTKYDEIETILRRELTRLGVIASAA